MPRYFIITGSQQMKHLRNPLSGKSIIILDRLKIYFMCKHIYAVSKGAAISI